MNIDIICVGKIKEKYLKDAISEYTKRLQSYAKINIIELADEQVPENIPEKQVELIKDKEGDRILSKIKDGSFVVTLEILGHQMSSEKFADFIKMEMELGGGRNLAFIIGGSTGLSKKVMFRSDLALSFSEMTFPHQLMRVILLEQIYRAHRIISGHPYHK